MWIFCMLCFDRNSSGCIRILLDRLSSYSVLNACVAKMASHAIFQYNVLAIDDTQHLD